jgi:uncharacterized protein YndB with AHSA1/START domain
MSKSTFAYVTFIRTTPERLWDALTTPEFMGQYWFGYYGESDWTPGSAWKLRDSKGHVASLGEVVEAAPPRRLVLRWQKPDAEDGDDSLCTFTIEDVPDNATKTVKLSIVHSSKRERSDLIEKVAGGWPRVLSNLKSFLETGEIILAAA